ncbi:amidophosphoribosyltransferase [Clostridium pasteurianum]|uniref:Amidophosphoribosyltransferase n=1 Tax=Clostridium pasteurianum BC1 TaxID=86416 RepID=R4K8R4_CLOPA|nr:amidophosphoribosyltransferase [Clostridium pasteurianum]AGK96939.1 amidophosphoribosyltransferase [Clostridium pasteurianum BC1]
MIDLEQDKLKEECGVFGIFSNRNIDVSHLTYYGLYALQHRGQESAGIAVCNNGKIDVHKGMGLVTDVFDNDSLDKMVGNSAIGHVRYSTTGGSCANNAQPIVNEFELGSIALAHNGNLVNTDIIRELLQYGGTSFETSIDTEVVLKLIAKNAKKGIENAVADAIQAIKGSFAIVILTEDKLIGVRDPNGIRPLCIGKFDDNSYVMCSETCALDAVGAEFVRDVNPGEIVIIDKEGIKSINFAEKTKCETCVFEYIYFARPDSVIDGISVYNSRELAGEELYREAPVEADMVIGVPDSGLAAATGYAKASGIPYGIGLIKNRYVGRTFISPTQELREKAVAVKLNPLKVNIEGKRIVIIDDSIVRGTTSKKLVDILRKAGAKEIHFRVSSPIIKYPCYFGINIASRNELIGGNKTVEEIRDFIGADSLAYLSIDSLLKSLGKKNNFCLGCLKGVYPVSAPMEVEKERFEV